MKNKLKIVAGIILAVLIGLLIFRAFSAKELDDVSPGIPCDKNLLEKSDILYVIPLFENASIAENKTWCTEILDMNKTLAMHGVYHIYNEFMTERDEFYVEEGASAFKACFGNYPSRFKAPQLAISAQNRELIEQDYMLDGYINQIIHKIYHCGDSGRLPNWLQDLI